MMNIPRYIVYIEKSMLYRQFNSLVEALEFKGLYGGIIYEPLGMATAEKVVNDSEKLYDGDY